MFSLLIAAWVLFARKGKKLPEARTEAKPLPKGGAAPGAKALPATTSAAPAASGKGSGNTKKNGGGASATDTVKTKASDAKGKSGKSEPAKAETKPAAKVEPKPERSRTEAGAEGRSEGGTEARAQARAQGGGEGRAEAGTEDRGEAHCRAEAGTEAGAGRRSEGGAEAHAQAGGGQARPHPCRRQGGAGQEGRAHAAAEAGVEAKPVAKAEPAPKVEAKPAPTPAAVEAKPAPKTEPAPAAKAAPVPSPSTVKVDAAAAAAKASPVELKKMESVRPALSSHHEIQDTSIPAAADVPLGTPAFSFATAAARWQPESAKDSGDAHATLLEEHLFVLAANRNGAQGSVAIKALREAKGSSGWRSVLGSKGADATPTVAAFFPGGGTTVELSRIGDGQGYRLRGGTLTKITGDGSAREVEKKIEQVDVGDLYILCSAELARTVPEEEIRELLMLDLDPTNGVRDLLAVSGDRDPNADVNVFVVRVDPIGGY